MKNSDNVPTKPVTEKQWAICRCKLSCKIGKDVLDNKKAAPAGVSATEYALYTLLCAVEELAAAIETTSCQ